MKRKLALLLAMCVVTTAAISPAGWNEVQAAEAGLDGSEETVYLAEENVQEIPEGYTPIYDIADLYAIRNDTDGKYILMNDIDMTEDTSEGGDYDCGMGWDSIEEFSGTLDGNGHRIIGMHIFGEITSGNVGLFEEARGTIKNLGMVKCDIRLTAKETGTVTVGTIAGQNVGYGWFGIEDCYSSGEIVINGNGLKDCFVGGLVGRITPRSTFNTDGYKLFDCYNGCEINVSNVGSDSAVGGICGDFECHWNGYSLKLLGECYNSGRINGNGELKIGAVFGEFSVGRYFVYANLLYLRGTAPQGMGNRKDDANCVSLTEAQMKNPKLYTGFDFTDTWEIDPYCSYQYPQLKSNRMIKISSIHLASPPEKLIYQQGEALQLGNTAIEINYEDGIKTSIPLTADMLGGYDMAQLGTQTVTVNYGGQKTSFEIQVREIPVSSITIPAELSLYRSKEYQLRPEILPENASDRSVSWKSDNPSVVSIDSNGLIKAMANGTAVITAVSSNGLTAQCTVTVLVPAISVQLSKTAVTLTVGQSSALTAQVLPLESTDTVKWLSSDSTVAEVFNGTVVAKKAGTAAITAYTDSGAQAICTVTVQKPAVTPNPGGGNQNPGGGSSGITAPPGSSNTSLIWKVTSTKAKVNSAKNVKTKSMKLKLGGLSGNTGYQIQYGLKKNFKGAKTITKKSSSVTIKKLKLKKTYYVRARVYRKISGITYYGKWSSRKTVKITK